MNEISIFKFFKRHIKNTPNKSPVILQDIFICNLTIAVKKACKLNVLKVHITSKIIKHLYDGKPAEEFDFTLKNIAAIVKYPDRIYKNRDSKRGDYCFVKLIGEFNYLASIECSKIDSDNKPLEEKLFIVTCFRVRDINYLKKYELVWSWKGGRPSS